MFAGSLDGAVFLVGGAFFVGAPFFIGGIFLAAALVAAADGSKEGSPEGSGEGRAEGSTEGGGDLAAIFFLGAPFFVGAIFLAAALVGKADGSKEGSPEGSGDGRAEGSAEGGGDLAATFILGAAFFVGGAVFIVGSVRRFLFSWILASTSEEISAVTADEATLKATAKTMMHLRTLMRPVGAAFARGWLAASLNGAPGGVLLFSDSQFCSSVPTDEQDITKL